MKHINLISPIGYTGYGITSLNILRELTKLCSVSLFSLSNLQSLSINSQDDADVINQSLKNAAYFHKDAINLKVWHPHDMALRAGNGPMYAFPFFELDTISELEKHHLSSCDGIFVASEWGKQILIDNGINVPIYVAPLGVDTSIFKNDDAVNTTSDDKPYIFFNVGKWEHRKSHDVVLECFDNAFDINDNVQLWLFPHNPFLNEKETDSWYDIVRKMKLSSKVRIYNRLNTQYDLASVIKQANCGVFVSRAEGWNNEILESMGLNKPIIATNYSAHTEYCNDKNSFLVPITELEIANDNKWFFGTGKWAKIGHKEKNIIMDHMRHVYKYKIDTNPEGLLSANKYKWSNTAEIIYANTKEKN